MAFKGSHCYNWLKWLSLCLLLPVGVFLFLGFAPFLLDYEPKSFSISFPETFDGPLKPNDVLSKADHLFDGELIGPESIAHWKGDIYTGLADGRVVRLRGDNYTTVTRIGDPDCDGTWYYKRCGRPMALRFDSRGDLYVIDARVGINKIQMINDSAIVTNVFNGSLHTVNGMATMFVDDMAIDEGAGQRGGHVFYILDASSKWTVDYAVYITTEHDSSGRLIRFDSDTGETSLLLGNLSLPSGVEMTDDRNSLIFGELNSRRIMIHHIRGPNTGATEALLDNLPGEPDNIRRSASTNETFWVALFAVRDASDILLSDMLSERPLIKKVGFRFLYYLGSALQWVGKVSSSEGWQEVGFKVKTGYYVAEFTREYGMVIEINKEGHIVKSLHSPDCKTTSLSEVREVIEGWDRVLYLGSFYNHYLGRLVIDYTSFPQTAIVTKDLIYLPLPEAFVGPLQPNNILSKASHLFSGRIHGPESVAQWKGDIYTGVSDGRILRIRDGNYTTVARMGGNNECHGVWDMNKCGRALGLRFDSKGDLYTVDAYFGIKKIDTTTGEVTPIFDMKAHPIEGRAPIFIDDFALEEGAGASGGHVFYMSDSSAKWTFDMSMLIAGEHDSTGRLIRYDSDTQSTSVLLRNISFPNGVEISDTKDAIIYSELNKRRIMKHYIKGPKTGTTEVLTDNLPGEPDNIRRSMSKKETYWVALFGARNSTNPSLFLDKLTDKPLIKRLIARLLFHSGSGLFWLGNTFNFNPLKELGFGLKTGFLFFKLNPQYGMVLEINGEGKIVRSVHSPDKLTTSLSEVREVIEGNDRVLYLGSYFNDFLGRLVLTY